MFINDLHNIFLFITYYYQMNDTALMLASINNHKEVVEMILNVPNIDINLQEKVLQFNYVNEHNKICIVKKNGNTALIFAARSSHKEIVEMLLKMPNININLKNIVNENYFFLK